MKAQTAALLAVMLVEPALALQCWTGILRGCNNTGSMSLVTCTTGTSCTTVSFRERDCDVSTVNAKCTGFTQTVDCSVASTFSTLVEGNSFLDTDPGCFTCDTDGCNPNSLEELQQGSTMETSTTTEDLPDDPNRSRQKCVGVSVLAVVAMLSFSWGKQLH
mmetsp:Transcript_67022/g.160633  ORF Transcript_67022/g.160633 Transcript_67022/m.160633 type:complete len:161 (+) Transcript_67022:74-556(+)